MNKDKRFDIRLSDNDRGMLRSLSQKMNRSQSDAVRQLIRDAYAQLGKGKEAMTVTNANGKSLNFDAAVNLMDDELREAVHSEKAPCTNQEFFTAYEKAHAEKYGQEWELSKRNPTW